MIRKLFRAMFKKKWLIDCPKCKEQPCAFYEWWGYNIQCPCGIQSSTQRVKTGNYKAEEKDLEKRTAKDWKKACDKQKGL